MDDNSQATNSENKEGEEKQSNRTFTQSDVDSMLAKEANKISERYKDYDNLKTTVDELTAFKKNAELASMSDSEKAQAQINDLNSQLNNAIAINEDLQKSKVKNDVLSRSEFNVLPRAYKSLVEANTDEEAVLASANKALEEFTLDTGKNNQTTIGTPKINNVIGQPDIIGNNDQSTLNFRERFKEKLKRKTG